MIIYDIYHVFNKISQQKTRKNIKLIKVNKNVAALIKKIKCYNNFHFKQYNSMQWKAWLNVIS
jgi:hypothetical protein